MGEKDSVAFFIFSRDRACQLEQLLRSLKRYLEPYASFKIGVFYLTTSGVFRRGYEVVQHLYPECHFIEEDRTRPISDQIFPAFQRIAAESSYIGFMVDDMVMLRSFSLSSPQFKLFCQDPEIGYLSLRLSPEISYSQVLATPIAQPPIQSSGKFQWHYPGNRFQKILQRRKLWKPRFYRHWSFPMAVDGNIYRREHIIPAVQSMIGIESIGHLEQELASFPPVGDFGVCFEKARILNAPLNRVDSAPIEWPHKGISCEYLNEKFLAGERLRSDWMSEVLFNSPHVDIPIFWERRMD